MGCARTEPLEEAQSRPPVDAQPTGNCVLDERGGVCTAGGCTLVVPPGALATPTPVEIGRIPVPAAVRSEVFGDIACQLGPASLRLDTPAQLILDVDRPAPGFEAQDAVAVFVNGAALTLAPDTQVQPGAGAVALSVDSASIVALTFLAVRVRQVGEISAEAAPVTDAPSLIRNLTARRFVDVEYDGRRLYLAAGDRVLVYENGIPDGLQAPDFVLGAPSLTAPSQGASAASFGATVNGVWSDGARLAVAAGNRVLIWNQPPTVAFTPADLVLGQANFTDDAANRGRDTPDRDTLFAPNQIESDGVRFAVADSQNHRILIWTQFPRFVGQPADLVVGQAEFDARDVRAGAVPLFQARGVLFGDRFTIFSSTLGANCVFAVAGFPSRSNPTPDLCIGVLRRATRVGPLELSQPGAMQVFGDVGLAVRDFVGRRLTLWRDFPDGGEPPDLVLGKPDFTVGGAFIGGTNASAIADGNVFAGFYADAQRLIVPDEFRVLVYEPLPQYNFASASRVIGPPGFSTRTPGIDYAEIDDDSLGRPGAVAVRDGVVAIADTANDRVLYFPTGLNGERRPIVLGQPDAKSFGPNRGGTPSLATLSGPQAVLIDENWGLYVADTGNHRVLVWPTPPTQDGQAAERLVGQRRSTDQLPNRGATDADGDGRIDADRFGFFYPSGLALVGSALFVADTHNHRVLQFDRPNLAAGALGVIGQPDFVSNAPNLGGGYITPVPGGLAGPTGLAASETGTGLYVADTENNRILLYSPVNGAPQVFGQDDLQSLRAPNFTPGAPGVPLPDEGLTVAADSLRRPQGLASADGQLFVADTGNHRVVRLVPGDGDVATRVIGQPTFDSRVVNAFGPSGRSLASPTSVAASNGAVYVLDRDNHRLLTFSASGLTANGSREPLDVFGQPDLLENGFNRSLGSRRNLADPIGVVRVGGLIWVSDRARHRVLGFRDGEAVIVLGQPNLTRTLVNAGGEPSSATLSGPTGLATDGRRLIVADTDNHRVLIWNQIPTESGARADVVIGQGNAQSVLPNRGRGLGIPDFASLRFPRGVYIDADRVVVADAGNNRVLVFAAEPAPFGARAEDVLCQPDFDISLPNGGNAGAVNGRCHGPSGVALVGERIAVADTLNDRVLVFAGQGALGRPADAVLGQPDFETRGATEVSARSLAGPVALASDGVNLLVADDSNNRVMVFFTANLENGAAARQVVGQASFESRGASRAPTGLDAPSGIYVERVSFIESRLWVSDNGNGRVVELSGVRR